MLGEVKKDENYGEGGMDECFNFRKRILRQDEIAFIKHLENCHVEEG